MSKTSDRKRVQAEQDRLKAKFDQVDTILERIVWECIDDVQVLHGDNVFLSTIPALEEAIELLAAYKRLDHAFDTAMQHLNRLREDGSPVSEEWVDTIRDDINHVYEHGFSKLDYAKYPEIQKK